MSKIPMSQLLARSKQMDKEPVDNTMALLGEISKNFDSQEIQSKKDFFNFHALICCFMKQYLAMKDEKILVTSNNSFGDKVIGDIIHIMKDNKIEINLLSNFGDYVDKYLGNDDISEIKKSQFINSLTLEISDLFGKSPSQHFQECITQKTQSYVNAASNYNRYR